MPRKGYIAKRDVLADPIYNSKLVTRLINKLMVDGKRGVAQTTLYNAFSKIEDFITCPSDYSNASFAYKVPDNSMAPLLKENTYAYIEFSGLLSNKEVGFFKYNDEFLIRRIVYKRGKILLRADSKEVEDIHLQNNDDFKIIGKVYI